MGFLFEAIVAVIVGYILILWLLRRLKVGNYETRYVFITGCDTGFGNLLAKRLANQGFNVFAGCLTQDSVSKFKTTNNVTALLLDVTDETSIQKAREFVEKKLPKGKGLWAIVNNAGIAGVVSPTEWLKNEDFRQVMEINFFGVAFVTKAFIPLVRKGRGRIVNMSSICGRFAIATSTYSASKYAVEGFSDSLRRDLYSTGVTVHLIEPGFFCTGIVSEDTLCQGLDARFSQAPTEVKNYYGLEYMHGLKKKTSRMLSKILSPKIYKVVDSYEHAITARFPKTRYVVGFDANILFRFLWNLPEWLTDFFLCILIPKPAGKHKERNGSIGSHVSLCHNIFKCLYKNTSIGVCTVKEEEERRSHLLQTV